MKKVTILGSTGSIGCNTLQVIKAHPDKYSVYALTAHQNIALLIEQCRAFCPQVVVVSQAEKEVSLKAQLREANLACDVLMGEEGLIAVASAAEVDIVMAAIVGAAGLQATLAAAQAGKRILLANKESLVMAGQLLMQAVSKNGAELLPIDSEHNAIFQCLAPHYKSSSDIRKVILTASGGPFLRTPLADLAYASIDAACDHPKWKMGRKISVDSATMMNKALEIIEAHFLFQLSANQIEVLIHPQSIVHSMVEYCDGSVLAEMANPDMRVPIAYGLAWPHRIDSGVASLNLKGQTLEFEELDLQRFPCFSLAYDSLNSAVYNGHILNAANEVAVAAFLEGQIKFTQIYEVIAETVQKVSPDNKVDLESILEYDRQARHFAKHYLTRLI
jgi:1-deoxy-D-xylulose-5-phosphate reductoisomerase